MVEAAKVKSDTVLDDIQTFAVYLQNVDVLLDKERIVIDALQREVDKHKVPVTKEYWDKVREITVGLYPDMSVLIPERNWDWEWDVKEIEEL